MVHVKKEKKKILKKKKTKKKTRVDNQGWERERVNLGSQEQFFSFS